MRMMCEVDICEGENKRGGASERPNPSHSPVYLRVFNIFLGWILPKTKESNDQSDCSRYEHG